MKPITAAALVLLGLSACGSKTETAAPAAASAVPEAAAHSGASNKSDDGWLAEAQEISRNIVRGEDPEASELLVKSGGLPPAARYSYQVTVQPGRYYSFFADCDYDCSNIDLAVKDAAGQTLQQDFEPDDAPMFGIRPKTAGVLTVDVVMSRCEAQECRFSSQVFEGGKNVF